MTLKKHPMENEDVVVVDNENTTDEIVIEDEEETVESLKAKLEEEREARTKSDEIAHNQKIRAEKAEKKAKEATPQTEGMSSSDLFAVMKADVHEDDIERIEKFAKMEGISVKDALKNPELKAILSVREEQRTTASATNVTNARRGAGRVSEETLVSNASKGKLPETDEDIDRLIRSKMGLK